MRTPIAVLSILLAVIVTALVAVPTGNLRTESVLGGSILAYAIVVALVLWFRVTHLRRLEAMALSDSLCGLPNRRALHDDIRTAARANPEIALAMIDLDGFKSVNDFYGHAIGDRALVEVGSILLETVADHGRAYRLGGDEFALVVAGPLAGNIVEGMCRRLLDRLAEPIMIENRSLVLGASIGLSSSATTDQLQSSVLLRNADVAMYASKARGKRRTTWFNVDFDRHRESQHRIDGDLRIALAEDHFKVHYQPLIDASSGQITAVEALVRWERPDGQVILPDEFIPVAEETGLIEAIGNWVLRQACSDALAWGDLKLSVNVSTVQLRNPHFPLQMGQILEETGFPPARLELEITETFLIGDQVIASRNLALIREFGVSIALDDYGTGYASIGYLRHFRFEKLKLDRSLIAGAATDGATRAVMSSSVAIAKALGMRVTAEGIETEIDATLARIAGCDQMQGWLYSKAVCADALNAQLLEQLVDTCPEHAVLREPATVTPISPSKQRVAGTPRR